MNNYEEINKEIQLVLEEYCNQDKLKQEYLKLKEQHKRVIRLLDNIYRANEFVINSSTRRKLYDMRESCRVRRNILAEMIEDKAWLYSNLT